MFLPKAAETASVDVAIQVDDFNLAVAEAKRWLRRDHHPQDGKLIVGS
jgi:hypothetical protein